MTRRLPLLAWLALALVVPAARTAAAEEIERVVAVIRSPAVPEPRVITRGRLEDETRIALVGRGGALAATRPLDGAALHAGLEWLIDEILLMDEASRLEVFEIDRGDVLAEVQRFRALFRRSADYEAFLARSDLTEEELGAVLRRGLRVKRYVESRVSHAGQVPESEVSAWLDTHPAQLPADREAARAGARARLAEERVRAEVKALVRELRARADVRVLDDLGAAGGRG
jgi:hypothetical protein